MKVIKENKDCVKKTQLKIHINLLTKIKDIIRKGNHIDVNNIDVNH